MEIDAHTVVPDAEAAAAWYARAFGAEEVSRIPLPSGRVLSVELRFGDSHVHVAGELPDFGIVSPLTLGGTATVLQIKSSYARVGSSASSGTGTQMPSATRRP